MKTLAPSFQAKIPKEGSKILGAVDKLVFPILLAFKIFVIRKSELGVIGKSGRLGALTAPGIYFEMSPFRFF